MGEGFDTAELGEVQKIGGDLLGIFPYALSSGNPMLQSPIRMLDNRCNPNDFIVLSRETRGVEDPASLKVRMTLEIIVGKQRRFLKGSYIEGEHIANLNSMEFVD